MTITLDRLVPRFFSASPRSTIWNLPLVWQPGIHVVVAASGRGKSSLLKQIAGVETTCDGAVSFSASATRAVAYMEQQLRCAPSFRVRELFRLGLPNQDPPSLTLIDQHLQRVGLVDVLDRICGTLSRGELQRVLFLRAFLQTSDWLLLDEPWAHVDPETAQRMADLLIEAVGRGRGVVIASLDNAEAKLFESATPTTWSLS